MTTETWDVTSPAKPIIKKDVQSKLDYSEDWTQWLGLTDVILTFTVIPNGLMTEISKAHDGYIATAFLDSALCVAGTTESVTYRIQTFEGRQDDRTLFFKIKER